MTAVSIGVLAPRMRVVAKAKSRPRLDGILSSLFADDIEHLLSEEVDRLMSRDGRVFVFPGLSGEAAVRVRPDQSDERIKRELARQMAQSICDNVSGTGTAETRVFESEAYYAASYLRFRLGRGDEQAWVFQPFERFDTLMPAEAATAVLADDPDGTPHIVRHLMDGGDWALLVQTLAERQLQEIWRAAVRVAERTPAGGSSPPAGPADTANDVRDEDAVPEQQRPVQPQDGNMQAGRSTEHSAADRADFRSIWGMARRIAERAGGFEIAGGEAANDRAFRRWSDSQVFAVDWSDPGALSGAVAAALLRLVPFGGAGGRAADVAEFVDRIRDDFDWLDLDRFARNLARGWGGAIGFEEGAASVALPSGQHPLTAKQRHALSTVAEAARALSADRKSPAFSPETFGLCLLAQLARRDPEMLQSPFVRRMVEIAVAAAAGLSSSGGEGDGADFSLLDDTAIGAPRPGDRSTSVSASRRVGPAQIARDVSGIAVDTASAEQGRRESIHGVTKTLGMLEARLRSVLAAPEEAGAPGTHAAARDRDAAAEIRDAGAGTPAGSTDEPMAVARLAGLVGALPPEDRARAVRRILEIAAGLIAGSDGPANAETGSAPGDGAASWSMARLADAVVPRVQAMLETPSLAVPAETPVASSDRTSDAEPTESGGPMTDGEGAGTEGPGRFDPPLSGRGLRPEREAPAAGLVPGDRQAFLETPSSAVPSDSREVSPDRTSDAGSPGNGGPAVAAKEVEVEGPGLPDPLQAIRESRSGHEDPAATVLPDTRSGVAAGERRSSARAILQGLGPEGEALYRAVADAVADPASRRAAVPRAGAWIETPHAGAFRLVRGLLDSRVRGIADELSYPAGPADDDHPAFLHALIRRLSAQPGWDPAISMLCDPERPADPERLRQSWREPLIDGHFAFQGGLLRMAAAHGLADFTRLDIRRADWPGGGSAVLGGCAERDVWPFGVVLGRDNPQFDPAPWLDRWQAAFGEPPTHLRIDDERLAETLPADMRIELDADMSPHDPSQMLRALSPAALGIPWADLNLSLAAAVVLRVWSRWLSGFQSSSVPYLIESFVHRSGRVRWSETRGFDVEIDDGGLETVIKMAGYHNDLMPVPWLKGRGIRFRWR